MELHHQLKNRTEVAGHLILDTAMHIGSGSQVSHSDSPVVRNQFGQAFIPGASLKGAFRSRVESLTHVLGEPHWACFLQEGMDSEAKHTCLSTDSKGSTQIQDKAVEKDITADKLATFLAENLCSACQLFGGASWRSKVLFDDLHLVESYDFPAELRDGVGIDRDSRKAVDGVKYDFEAVPAGSQFHFRLLAENITSYDWPLLSMGLLELLNGNLALGGKTSRGLGSCHLNKETFQVQSTDFTDRAKLLQYFKSGQSSSEEKPEGWLIDKLETYLSSQ